MSSQNGELAERHGPRQKWRAIMKGTVRRCDLQAAHEGVRKQRIDLVVHRVLWVFLLLSFVSLPLMAASEKQLIQAVNARQIEAAKKALTKGADPNAIDKKSGLPIRAPAARNCDAPMLQLLLERVHARAESVEQALNAARECSSCGDDGAIPVLLRASRTSYGKAKGSSCWVAWRKQLGPLLIELVCRGDLEGVRTLAAKSAPLDYQESVRTAPESSSANTGSNLAVSAWTAAVYSDEGPMALYCAVKARNVAMLQLLVEAGADTRIRFHELDSGRTKTTLAKVCDKLGYQDIGILLK